MNIKVISLEECNAATATIELIKKVAKELEMDLTPECIVVKTIEEANKHRHIGGPTVQINGLDIELEAREIEQFGIS